MREIARKLVPNFDVLWRSARKFVRAKIYTNKVWTSNMMRSLGKVKKSLWRLNREKYWKRTQFVRSNENLCPFHHSPKEKSSRDSFQNSLEKTTTFKHSSLPMFWKLKFPRKYSIFWRMILSVERQLQRGRKVLLNESVIWNHLRFVRFLS